MSREKILLSTPLTDETVAQLRVGDMVLLSGPVYTARDAAHQRLCALLEQGQEPPFPFQGQAVYYAGPCPAPPGQVIGSVGPTTSGRMDAYSPLLIQRGLKIMIGKGLRSPEVKRALVECGGVYLAAIGGAAALMSQSVRQVEMVAFEDLGTEAIRRLLLDKLPLVVAADCLGGDIYERSSAAQS